MQTMTVEAAMRPGERSNLPEGGPRRRAGLREEELRRQHLFWMRQGYDGHNRRSLTTTMDRLRARRRRRQMHQVMRFWMQAYA